MAHSAARARDGATRPQRIRTPQIDHRAQKHPNGLLIEGGKVSLLQVQISKIVVDACHARGCGWLKAKADRALEMLTKQFCGSFGGKLISQAM
jgi:hypothetical protein